MDAKQTACYHCKTLLSLPKEHSKYWRCGHCRKVNGRPNYARGFVSGFLYCGLCRFYFSRITHAVATTALVGIVGSGLLFFLPMISRRGRGVSFLWCLPPRVASTASSRRGSRIDGAEVLLAQGLRLAALAARVDGLGAPVGDGDGDLPARGDVDAGRRAAVREGRVGAAPCGTQPAS